MGAAAPCPRRDPPDDERSGIVDEDRLGHALEVLDGPEQTFTPVILALREERLDEQPAGVRQHRHEEEHAHERPAIATYFAPKVDLKLMGLSRSTIFEGKPVRREHARRWE